MSIPKPVKLIGAPGSPYTRKMLAVLRYRHIPYQVIFGASSNAAEGLPKPKVGLLPTFFLPDDSGQIQAVTDSTPLIRLFEREVSGRSVLPSDPVLGFLNYLLEDYGDEWLTKAMFHYRWYYDEDIDRAGEILPRWNLDSQSEEKTAMMKKVFSERQISRLYVVGSNDTTAPVIEASYHRYLDIMQRHLVEQPFLFGARPSSADFAAFGQLTALTHFDPTPMAYTLEHAPQVYAWVDLVDDLSGVEPRDSDWVSADSLPETVRELLTEVGRVYVPALLANAKALMAGDDMVETEIDGSPWTQKPFSYQGKCLQWLRGEYESLSEDARRKVDAILAGTGCEILFL